MGNCLATEQVCHEECESESQTPQIVRGSVADIARYMSYIKPADARLEVTIFGEQKRP